MANVTTNVSMRGRGGGLRYAVYSRKTAFSTVTFGGVVLYSSRRIRRPWPGKFENWRDMKNALLWEELRRSPWFT